MHAHATSDVEAEVAAVGRLDIVPMMLDVVCRATGMGFAAIARVTEDRWIACAVRDDIAFGLEPGGELAIETTICHEIRASGTPVVIDHVAMDEAFRRHPTPAMYGFESYISVPIVRPDGRFFGTLCAIDPRPARLSRPEIAGMFRLFAQLIGFHLDAHDQLEANRATLLDERQTGQLREEFVAVLGHDLRNPLAALGSGIRMLRREPPAEEATKLLDLMQGSVARMSALVDDVQDLARSRLGGGLELERSEARELGPVLEQVVAELRAGRPDRLIETRLALSRPVRCDPGRIAQLLSNLLANALTHGAPGGPVRVEASTDAERLELSVANAGEPLSPTVLQHLFRPFVRTAMRRSQQGLGLGLYIASEIARAHGGTLDVSSTAEETRFTFRMPLR